MIGFAGPCANIGRGRFELVSYRISSVLPMQTARIYIIMTKTFQLIPLLKRANVIYTKARSVLVDIFKQFSIFDQVTGSRNKLTKLVKFLQILNFLQIGFKNYTVRRIFIWVKEQRSGSFTRIHAQSVDHDHTGLNFCKLNSFCFCFICISFCQNQPFS